MESRSSLAVDAATAWVVRVPDNVVYRGFPEETVALNLERGKYHALNAVGGRMLEVLDQVGRLNVAAQRIAEEYERDVSEVTADMTRLCEDLEAAGLVVITRAE